RDATALHLLTAREQRRCGTGVGRQHTGDRQLDAARIAGELRATCGGNAQPPRRVPASGWLGRAAGGDHSRISAKLWIPRAALASRTAAWPMVNGSGVPYSISP